MTKRVQIATDNITVANVSALDGSSPAGSGVFMDVADSTAVAPYWTWNGNLVSPVFSFGAAPVLVSPFAPLMGTLTQLFVLNAANMNSTADQQFNQMFPFSKYVVSFVVAANPTASITTAAGGIYTAASKGGSAIIPASQVYSGLKTASDAINPQVATSGQELLSQSGVYLSLTTPQGSAATADLFIMGVAG